MSHGGRRTRALPVRDGEQLGEQEQGDRQQRGDHRPHARRHAAQADGRGRHGHRWRVALGVSHGRRCAAGDALVDVASADEFRRAHRLPDDAVLECALRHRRGGRLPGEVPGNASPVADPAATIAQDDEQEPPICRRCGRTSHTTHLVFRRGRQGRRHRHQRHARVSRARKPTRRRCRRSATSDSPNCRKYSTPTAERGGDNRSVLLVLQGMDTAGKGGIVKHVVGAANPKGIRYTAFGVPTEEERKHHYLWRIRRALPPAGHIGVFDRSHYEDVLIVRVHNIVPPEVWGKRYDEINKFEKKLVDSGTTIIKVAMFVSLDEQKKRLSKRLDDPTSTGSTTRKTSTSGSMWPAYQEAYQAVLERTSTDYAPWHVVPCDRSGTAGWRSSSCSSRRSRRSTCLGRQQISTSRRRRSGSPRPSQPLTRVN